MQQPSSPSLQQLPFFSAISDSQRILLAGAGGGFDIFSGIPLYLNLVAQGKEVVLANLAFTWLDQTSSAQVFPNCFRVLAGDKDLSGRGYFPEKVLALWLVTQGHTPPLYGLNRAGVLPIRDAYKYLIKEHQIDTIILVDGGTDSLMFGDEEGLGTPVEDVCSMAAVYRSGIKHQFLVNLGFGVDHFHGVSHYRFLENVAHISREGGYLGAFSLLPQMPEAQAFLEAVRFANRTMTHQPSIVSNSIASAIEGEYGNHHRTDRTAGSELWINPLMSMYWAFDLRAVVKKITYYDWIKDTKSMSEIQGQIAAYWQTLAEVRGKKQIPI